MKTLKINALIIVLLHHFSLQAQSNWVIANAADPGFKALLKQAGNTTGSLDMADRLEKIHKDASGNPTGSVIVLRRGGSFWDRMILIRGGFMIFIREDGPDRHWTLIRVYSTVWLNFIHSIVPADCTKPLQCPPKRTTLTATESEALDKLANVVKGAYCKVPSNVGEELIDLLMTSKSVDLAELEKKQAQEEQMQMEKSRKERLANGIPRILRLIEYNGKFYGVDPDDGFAYYEIESYYNGGLLDIFKSEINRKKGEDFENRCPQINAGCIYTTTNKNGKEIEIAKAKSATETIPDAVLAKYRIKKKPSDDGKKQDKSIGIEVTSNVGSLVRLHACPPILNTQTSIHSLEKLEANTYLIEPKSGSDINNWLLLTGNGCYKCKGVAESMLGEIHTPKGQAIKILKISNLNALTSTTDTPEKKNLMESVRKAIRLAEAGNLLNNTADYLGEGGLVYRNAQGQKSIYTDNIAMTYAGTRIEPAALNEWLRIFDRYHRNMSAVNSETVVAQLFESAASGKTNWFKTYRQNPMTFVAKYCKTEKQ